MRRIIIKSVISAALLACAMSINAQVSVKGQIKGMRTDSVIVITTDHKSDQSTRDTLVWKKGKFALSYPNTNMLQIYIYEKPAPGERLNHGTVLYLLPNKPMTVSGTLDDLTTKGCDIYDKVQTFQHDVAPVYKKLDAVNKAYEKEGPNAKTEEDLKALREKYFPDMRKYSKEMYEYTLNYIKQNPDNEACCVAINNCKDFYAAYNVMTDRVKNCELALAFKQHKEIADRRIKQEEQEKKLDNGAEAPDFTLKDINGNDFKLSSLRGKYVMLDFWGSWCGWCIKALPDMKECYNKHKDSGKFEIVSIDCRDTEEKWKAAVKQHGMTWTQVKSEKQDDIPTLYGVPGYPTFIIINPEGKIIKRYVGSGEELYTYIDSLFQ